MRTIEVREGVYREFQKFAAQYGNNSEALHNLLEMDSQLQSSIAEAEKLNL